MKTNYACIFDLDGVIIDNERLWEDKKRECFTHIFGNEITAKLGVTTGIDLDTIYERAVAHGATIAKEEYSRIIVEELGPSIYKNARLSEGLQELVRKLVELGYVIGIVSSSPKSWINIALDRLSFRSDIAVVISLHDRADLHHKPSADGYREAMRQLQSTPATTIIVEDSDVGIASAKASGAHTIGLRQNLVPGYQQHGADEYVDNLIGVAHIAEYILSAKS